MTPKSDLAGGDSVGNGAPPAGRNWFIMLVTALEFPPLTTYSTVVTVSYWPRYLGVRSSPT